MSDQKNQTPETKGEKPSVEEIKFSDRDGNTQSVEFSFSTLFTFFAHFIGNTELLKRVFAWWSGKGEEARKDNGLLVMNVMGQEVIVPRPAVPTHALLMAFEYSVVNIKSVRDAIEEGMKGSSVVANLPKNCSPELRARVLKGTAKVADFTAVFSNNRRGELDAIARGIGAMFNAIEDMKTPAGAENIFFSKARAWNPLRDVAKLFPVIGSDFLSSILTMDEEVRLGKGSSDAGDYSFNLSVLLDISKDKDHKDHKDAVKKLTVISDFCRSFIEACMNDSKGRKPIEVAHALVQFGIDNELQKQGKMFVPAYFPGALARALIRAGLTNRTSSSMQSAPEIGTFDAKETGFGQV